MAPDPARSSPSVYGPTEEVWRCPRCAHPIGVVAGLVLVVEEARLEEVPRTPGLTVWCPNEGCRVALGVQVEAGL